MKVTKAQSQANRSHIVQTASVLFRERGYDGVGVADPMATADLTHGGFYKHFDSKAALMADAAACSFEATSRQAVNIEFAVFIDYYLSRKHRDARGAGCTLAALGGDVARQSAEIRSEFARGIERMLADLPREGDEQGAGTRVQHVDIFARLVGAIVLSRACPDDSPLADEILAAYRSQLPAPN